MPECEIHADHKTSSHGISKGMSLFDFEILRTRQRNSRNFASRTEPYSHSFTKKCSRNPLPCTAQRLRRRGSRKQTPPFARVHYTAEQPNRTLPTTSEHTSRYLRVYILDPRYPKKNIPAFLPSAHTYNNSDTIPTPTPSFRTIN
jgi:hypothetical protein